MKGMDGWVRKFYVSSALRSWIHLTKRAGNQTKTIMNRRFGYVQLAAVILPVHRSSFIYMMFTKHLLKTSFGSLTYFGFCRLGIFVLLQSGYALYAWRFHRPILFGRAQNLVDWPRQPERGLLLRSTLYSLCSLGGFTGWTGLLMNNHVGRVGSRDCARSEFLSLYWLVT